jgi:hypothetical protein
MSRRSAEGAKADRLRQTFAALTASSGQAVNEADWEDGSLPRRSAKGR